MTKVINISDYKVKVPYVSKKKDPLGYIQYNIEAEKCHQKFLDDMDEYYGLSEKYSKELVRYIHRKAWDIGHHSGYSEVYNSYLDVMEEVDAILKENLVTTRQMMLEIAEKILELTPIISNYGPEPNLKEIYIQYLKSVTSDENWIEDTSKLYGDALKKEFLKIAETVVKKYQIR